MNCTMCGKPHSREQPLTVAHNDEWLCPGCLKERDTASPSSREIIEHIFSKYDIPLYGRSPVEVAEDYVKSRSTGLKGTIKIGDMELPIESFEMR